MIETITAFRDARDAGEYDQARRYLTDNARVWYEERYGNGYPVELGRGRYTTWDEHFRSESRLGDWQADSQSVWTVVTEMNDYYRLLERTDTSRYRLTYFFTDDGRIEGYMVSAISPEPLVQSRRDRFNEFREWARSNHSDEWEYLRPEGEFDPTGDRAERTRKLLNQWRESVGLPPIE